MVEGVLPDAAAGKAFGYHRCSALRAVEPVVKFALGRRLLSYSAPTVATDRAGRFAIPHMFVVRRWGVYGRHWFFGVMTSDGETHPAPQTKGLAT